MRVVSRFLGTALAATALSFPMATLGAQRATEKPIGEAAPLVTLPAPASLAVRNDPAALVFSWQPVAGAVGYQIDAAPALAGPWTGLVPAPIASPYFSYSPAAGVLTYYRVAAVHTLGNAGNPAVMPFIYNPPFAQTGMSAVQSGTDLTVSWIPVAGATGYTVTASTSWSREQLQVFNSSTSATFAGLIPAGKSTEYYRGAVFGVTALFPRGVASVGFTGKGFRSDLVVFDPSLCWPSTAETPGGPAPAGLAATPAGTTVTITWTPLGQVLAHRVERAPTGSGKWEVVGCLPPTHNPFADQSVGLQPSTSYQYRVTAIGPGGVAGTSIATTTTPAGSPIVSSVPGYTTGIRLVWPNDPNVPGYLISSSYGYRAFDDSGLGGHQVKIVPSGTNLFMVTPFSVNGVSGKGTTIAVTVP